MPSHNGTQESSQQARNVRQGPVPVNKLIAHHPRMQALKTRVKTSFAYISAPYLKMMSGRSSANKQSLLYPV
jgi:hypothetical protein